jgi:hypothetical protein
LKAAQGEFIPAAILLIYVATGALVYRSYGLRHSRLAAKQANIEIVSQ